MVQSANPSATRCSLEAFLFDEVILNRAKRPARSGELVDVPELKLGDKGLASFLVHGENDAVLDAVSPTLNGAVKCIYIDPPYNNMESYTHYDDRDDHIEWISRLTGHSERLKPLLTDDGSIWISIDDRQIHYLKIALDGVFKRENFVATIVWEHRKTRENRRVFSNNHEYILVYAKNAESFKKSRNRLPYDCEVLKRFKNPDNDPRGPWQSVSLNVQAGHATVSQFHEIVAPSGKRHTPPYGRCWTYTAERVQYMIEDDRIYFGKDGKAVPRLKRFLSEIDGGLTPQTLWRADEVGTTDSAKKHTIGLFPDLPVFDTPKPEELLDRIFSIAANPGDLVMDSFLGSGTSAAVAIRRGLRFFGIERGGHIITHCHDRLKPHVREKGGIVHFLHHSNQRAAR